MARGFQGAMLRGLGARDHLATVTGTERVAPHMVRIAMTSPTLFDELTPGPTSWLRFWFPDPDGGTAEHQRAYTLSAADPAAGTFAIDVLLHEPAGPASRWASRAAAGDTVPAVVLGSAPFTVPPDPPAGYLLVGDPASVPAINGILGAVPADVPVELYLEEAHPEDRLVPLGSHPRLRLHRVPRAGSGSLAAAIEDRDWSDWYAWVAPESASLKALRGRLRDGFGFPKSEIHAQAYWVQGRAMGSQRADPTSAPHSRPDRAAPADRPAPPIPPDRAAPPIAPDTPAPRGRWRAAAAGRLLAPLRRTLVVAGVLQAVVTLVELAPFLLLVELARRLLGGAAAAELWSLGIAALVLLGIGTALAALLALWLHLVDARFARDVRGRLLDRLSRLPLGWFTARGSGSVSNLVQGDTLTLHHLVTHAVPDAVAAVVAPVAVLVYLFAVDWRLALVLLVPVLVYVGATASMMAASGTRIPQALRWAERMMGEAGGFLAGQPVIRVFGGTAASPFRHRLDEYLAFLHAWQRPFIGARTVMEVATRPGTFLWLVLAVGVPMVVAGALDPLALLPFLLLGTTFGARLLGIGYGLAGIREGRAAARRIAVALDEPELASLPGDAGDTRPGVVEFDRAGFGYRPGVPVLEDITLTLRPGTVTALVGPSGSGKSTLAALLARFHDVGSGAIRVGGDDVRTLTADQLYARVGFVLQDAQLVRGTVRDNIALAVPGASDEAVERAAADARIHHRIQQLPRGYDTVLGDDVALSGGERQRITIARAILADTPVLVLDEATAFADPESEFLVQQAIDRLTRDRTVLVVAHRLHTVTGVDRIVVLDGGRIVETGTHDELLAADGRYRRLWESGSSVTETATETVTEEAHR